MKSLLLNQFILCVVAVLAGLILAAQLPSPAFDVCAYGSNLEQSHWYYCGGGYLFFSGFIFAFFLFLLGPNSTWYRLVSVLLLVLFGINESLRANEPILSGLSSWLFSPVFGGSIFGALFGFCIATVIKRSGAKLFSPNKANQPGTR